VTLVRGIFVFIGALVFSALLWSYVRLSSAYEADLDLPVKLTPPKGYALASGLPERLHTRVRGAGWQIMLMTFTKNSDFQLDLTERAVPPTSTVIIPNDEIAHSAFLPSEVRVLKVQPDSLLLAFNKSIEKKLPIESRLDVTAANGYTIVGSPVVVPNVVNVIGAQNVVDSLRFIPTKAFEVHNAKEDVERSLLLSDTLANQVTIQNAPKVTVHVRIEAVGEKKFAGVPVSIEALPPQYEMFLIPNSVTVTVRGGVNQLAKLPPTSLRARVKYDPMALDTAHTVTPLVDVPNGITFLGTEPPAVKFIIRRKSPANASP